MTEFNLEDLPRRNFFVRAATFLLGSLVALLPASLAAIFLANPLFRTNIKDPDSDGFTPLGIKPSAIPEDGTPVRATVVADRIDAWNVYANQRVGNVWLRRNEDDELVAFSTICPHLGCSVEYRTADHDFFCPCHNSQFTLAGDPTNRIPPRPMDTIETRVQGDQIWIRYQDFRGGIAEKIPVS